MHRKSTNFSVKPAKRWLKIICNWPTHASRGPRRINPKYSIFHVGDTPAKCRQDLNKRLGIRSSPSDRAATSGGKADPFLAHEEAKTSADAATTAASADSDLTRLPPVDHSSPPPGAFNLQSAGNYPTTGQPPLQLPAREVAAATPKAQSDALLLGARKSLAVGDVQRAIALVEQAKRLQLTYALTDDSPGRIEVLVKKHTDLLAQRSHGETEGYRRQYASLLMEQSEGLLLWREFDEAERLALEAKKLPVQYNPIETRPETLLQRIASEQRKMARPHKQRAGEPNWPAAEQRGPTIRRLSISERPRRSGRRRPVAICPFPSISIRIRRKP